MYKNEGKVKLSLIDPLFIEGMARRQEFGDNKHKDNHWTEGVSVTDILDAVKRHVAAIELGEYNDKDGGTHAEAAALGLMYIDHYRRADPRYQQFFDQRYGSTDGVNYEVGRPGLPSEDAIRRINQTVGGGSGTIQRSLRPRGDCRRTDTGLGLGGNCGCKAGTCYNEQNANKY